LLNAGTVNYRGTSTQIMSGACKITNNAAFNIAAGVPSHRRAEGGRRRGGHRQHHDGAHKYTNTHAHVEVSRNAQLLNY
jgi:hypothetical protein